MTAQEQPGCGHRRRRDQAFHRAPRHCPWPGPRADTARTQAACDAVQSPDADCIREVDNPMSPANAAADCWRTVGWPAFQPNRPGTVLPVSRLVTMLGRRKCRQRRHRPGRPGQECHDQRSLPAIQARSSGLQCAQTVLNRGPSRHKPDRPALSSGGGGMAISPPYSSTADSSY